MAGGTSEIAKAMAREIGGRVSLRTRVTSVEAGDGGYLVEAVGPQGPRKLRARRVVCALPGPIAAEVIWDLPGWKLDALRAVHYGRWISIPIVVAPVGKEAGSYPLVASRPMVRYNVDSFMARTPMDLDAEGGCFHSFLADPAAKVVWDDPDDSIRSGAVRKFLGSHPQFSNRIVRVDVYRWEYGHPQYVRGLMKHFPLLGVPVDGISFAGDYTWQANMEGAVLSGQRAGDQVLGSLGEQ